MAGSAEPAASCHHGYASWVILANDGSSFLTSFHCAGTGCWVSGTADIGDRIGEKGLTTNVLSVSVCWHLWTELKGWHPQLSPVPC